MKTGIKLILCAMMIVSAMFAQNYWRGFSVATSDNLDALVLNPAGLGIQRGEQSGLHLFKPNEGDPTYHYAFRADGFGFKVYGQKKFDYSFALGGNLTKMLNFGYQWDSNRIHSLGLLFRPCKYASIGATATHIARADSTNSRFGIAVRPLGKWMTLGVDVISSDLDDIKNYDEFKGNSQLWSFLEIQPMPGVFVSGSFDEDMENFSISLGFDTGLNGSYVSANETEEYTDYEYGFYSHSQILKTILKKPVKDKKTFVRMKLANYMIEEKPHTTPFDFDFDFNLNPFANKRPHGTQLRRWIEKMDELTADEKIDGLIIDMEYVAAGFGKRLEMYDALTRFKDSGKTIIVYAQSMSNMDVYITAMADEIYIPELSEVDLRGLMIELQYFKGLMDTLDIVGEFVQISPYKSAADQFMRKNMSPEVRENWGAVFGDINDQFVQGIAAGKGWTDKETRAIIDNGPYWGQDAIDAGLITGFMYPDEFEKYIEEIDDQETIIKKWCELDRYDEYVHEWKEETNPKIAIIYAVGGIQSGKSQPGRGGSTVMGDVTISEAIKKAREDKDVEAIVFRIDSGGGSALASDIMWHEVIKTTDQDSANVKPFIASMSDVAASGGYYIACQADKIVAYPNTITGSIGVISGRFNFSGLLSKIGITTDKMKYGERSDFHSGNKLWSDEELALVRKGIEDVYGTFLNRVAGGREELDSLDVDAVGLGRIWSGNQAKEYKLIDEVGGLQKAVDIAKEAAGIAENQEIDIVEYPNFKRTINIKKAFGRSASIEEMLPEVLAEQLEILDMIPIFEDDQMQMIMPYKITVK